METLLVVAQHRNQYCGRSRSYGPARFGSFESPPSRGFKDINCRTFQSASAILPTPFKGCTTRVTKRASSCSPKTPSPSDKSHSEVSKPLKKTVKNGAVSMPMDLKVDTNKEGFFSDEFSYSELWAGPAYSNSPAPSSLPIPKFFRPKRTISLDLPTSSTSDFDLYPTAKSAPPSPSRDHSKSIPRYLFHSDDSATKTLRRILNLDIADE